GGGARRAVGHPGYLRRDRRDLLCARTDDGAAQNESDQTGQRADAEDDAGAASADRRIEPGGEMPEQVQAGDDRETRDRRHELVKAAIDERRYERRADRTEIGDRR